MQQSVLLPLALARIVRSERLDIPIEVPPSRARQEQSSAGEVGSERREERGET